MMFLSLDLCQRRGSGEGGRAARRRRRRRRRVVVRRQCAGRRRRVGLCCAARHEKTPARHASKEKAESSRVLGKPGTANLLRREGGRMGAVGLRKLLSNRHRRLFLLRRHRSSHTPESSPLGSTRAMSRGRISFLLLLFFFFWGGGEPEWGRDTHSSTLRNCRLPARALLTLFKPPRRLMGMRELPGILTRARGLEGSGPGGSEGGRTERTQLTGEGRDPRAKEMESPMGVWR